MLLQPSDEGKRQVEKTSSVQVDFLAVGETLINYVIVVMGVSGCGKTTVGRALAARLGCSFHDGDDYHPLENVAKMAGGVALDDADRSIWLARLHDLIVACLGVGETAVIACSALKKKYREQLRGGLDSVFFVYLHGSYELILRRMQVRQNHYMKAGLLQSQFDALDEPDGHQTLSVPVTMPVNELVDRIVLFLG